MHNLLPTLACRFPGTIALALTLLALLAACGSSDAPEDRSFSGRDTSSSTAQLDTATETAGTQSDGSTLSTGETRRPTAQSAPATDMLATQSVPATDMLATQSAPATPMAPVVPTLATAIPNSTPRPTPTPAGSPQTDREALIAIFNDMGGPNWRGGSRWLSEQTNRLLARRRHRQQRPRDETGPFQ